MQHCKKKNQESSALWNSSRGKKAVHYLVIINLPSHVLGCDTQPLSSATISYCNAHSKSMKQSLDLCSTMYNMFADYFLCFMETNLYSQRMKFYKETNVSKMEMLPFWQQNHLNWVWVSLWILCPIIANLVQLWIFLYSYCHASALIFFSFVFKGDCTTCFQCTSCRRINKT